MSGGFSFFVAQSIVLALPQNGQPPVDRDWSIPQTLVFLCSDDAKNNDSYRASIAGSKKKNIVTLSRIISQDGRIDFKSSLFVNMKTQAKPYGDDMTALTFTGTGKGNVEATPKPVLSKASFAMTIYNGQIGKRMASNGQGTPSHIQVNYKSAVRTLNLSCTQLGPGGVPL